MTDELFPYYDQELAFIRKLGAEFAEANPKIAGRLRLGGEAAEDPHVSRLIEAFAYLNARTRHKLDDDFPELNESLLGVLYPHYLAPIPSMAIVQFALDRGQAGLTSGYEVPVGSPLLTEPIEGEPCRFQTRRSVTLWPIRLVGASLRSQPFAAPPAPCASQSAAVVQLSLQTLGGEAKFADLEFDELIFYLHGQAAVAHGLYELIHNHVLGVAAAESANDDRPTLLPATRIEPVGFAREESMLPYPARSFPGYALLTEYFAFPEKFLFFRLTGLSQARARLRDRMELFIYLRRSTRALEQHVGVDAFRLGCAPVVNLFKKRADPIRLTHRDAEYRVSPDARRPQAYEVYSIDRVASATSDDRRVEYRSFYSVEHGAGGSGRGPFWHAARRAAGYREGRFDEAGEVYLTLVDLDFRPSAPEDHVLDVETTCLSRDLPQRLPFGGGQPALRLEGAAPLERVVCLTPPTPTRRPPLRDGARWRLISHLALNHLSLVDSPDGADALREILRLYDFNDSEDTRRMISGVASVEARRVTGRVRAEGGGGLCRGLEVTVTFDPDRFRTSGAYLFASVLERFLGGYVSINSFTQLIAKLYKREGELCRWPPRSGDRTLA